MCFFLAQHKDKLSELLNCSPLKGSNNVLSRRMDIELSEHTFNLLWVVLIPLFDALLNTKITGKITGLKGHADKN